MEDRADPHRSEIDLTQLNLWFRRSNLWAIFSEKNRAQPRVDCRDKMSLWLPYFSCVFRSLLHTNAMRATAAACLTRDAKRQRVGSSDDDEAPPAATQGVASPPRRAPAAADGNDDSSDDDDWPAGTQGEAAAAPVLRLIVSVPTSSAQPQRPVRIALTGCRDGPSLQRYCAVARALGAEVDAGPVISSAVTHVIVFPAVGAKRTAKSIWAYARTAPNRVILSATTSAHACRPAAVRACFPSRALTKKVLVSPCWLDASSQHGTLLPLTPAHSTSTSITLTPSPAPPPLLSSQTPPLPPPLPPPSPPSSPPHAVRGISNPLDGTRVHVTAAFIAQHRADATVRALLTEQAYLLHAARQLTSAHAASADFIFAAEDEAEGWRPVDGGGTSSSGALPLMPPAVLTWERFLERLVPGHARRWLQPSCRRARS